MDHSPRGPEVGSQSSEAGYRDRGERLKDYALKDINRLGELWFARHPELIEEATIGLLFRRSKLASDAQKKQDEKASPVQKSRSKVEASS